MIKQIKKIASIVFGFTVIALALMSGSEAQSVAQSKESGLQVCRDENGNERSGDLDVVVLLDNSKSLSGKNNSGSDQSGRRFDAIDEFLENFSRTEVNNRGKNFGLIAFGTSARIVVELSAISNANVDEIKEKIKNEVLNSYETQDSHTNYISALSEARSTFEKSDPSNQNCRILIWFTDGVFDTNDSDKADEVSQDVRRLQGAICSSDGIASAFSKADINTFVVYLTPANPNQKRSGVSQDAMQAITGDRTPSFDSDGSKARQPQSPCEINSRHLGEVISVDDAEQLLGYLTDLVPTADGGVSVFPGDCPIEGNTGESFALIDGHLIEWISITSWSEMVKLDSLSILSNGGESLSLDQIFQVGEDGSKSGRLVKIYPQPNETSQEFLKAGWKLLINESGPVCVRLKLRDLSFVLSNVETKSEQNLPPYLFEGNRLLFFAGNKELDKSEALKNPLLRGELEVEFGEFLPLPNRMSVKVTVEGAFELSPPNCEIKVDYEDRESPTDALFSTSCKIKPARFEDTSIDATLFINELNKCEVGEWQIAFDGIPQDGSKKSLVGGSNETVLSVRTIEPPSNANKSCRPNSVASIEVSTSDGAESEISTSIEINLKRRGNPLLAIVLAVIATIFVSLLSLLLLQTINRLIVKTIDPNNFYGYETECEIVGDESGQASIVWPEKNSTSLTYVADPDLLQQLKSNSSRTTLSVGSIRFNRVLPKFFRPFEEARLVMSNDFSASFWRANRDDDGLGISFPKAIVLSVSNIEPSFSQKRNQARVTVIVPKRGFGAGYEGAQQLIRDKCDELANKLLPILSTKASALSTPSTDPASTKVSGGSSESSQQSPGTPIQNVPPPMNRDKPITSVPPVPRGVPTIKDQRNEPPKRPN
jgi:hypothetical protein